jgi:hypothetical protein
MRRAVVQCFIVNKSPQAQSVTEPPTITPPSSSLRHQRLGDHWTKFFIEQSSFPIFVTIQPNLWRAPSPVKVAPGTPATPANKAWAIFSTVFYRLDREWSGCDRVATLPPVTRLQGAGVMEKHFTNPHNHVLINCADQDDQEARGKFLFEFLDNVPKRRQDDRDEIWQQETWEAILQRGSISDDLIQDRTFSILTDIAPAGTAMVQVVRTEADLDTICRYMTKSWFQSQHQLATRAGQLTSEHAMDWKLLSDFHAPVPPSRQARRHRFDRKSGAVMSDTAHGVWKVRGRTIRK